MRLGHIVLGLLLASCVKRGSETRHEPASTRAQAWKHDSSSKELEFEGVRLQATTIDLRLFRISTIWKDSAGTPYGSLQGVAERIPDLVAAVNGGMFDTSIAPLGLLVHQGKTLTRLVTYSAGGNFFWKPNGVFYITKDGAHIVRTDLYASRAKKSTVEEATQSGPL